MRRVGLAAGAMAALVALAIGAGVVGIVAGGGDGDTVAVDAFGERVAAVADSAPPEQADLLEDGVVSAEEYRTAVDRVMACLDRNGVGHTEPQLDTSRYWPRWRFTTVVVLNPETGTSYYDECDATHLREVELVWSAQHRPSAAGIASVYDGIVVCAREAGTDVETVAEATEAMLALDFDDPLRLALSDCFATAAGG